MEARQMYTATFESCIAIPIPRIIADQINRIRIAQSYPRFDMRNYRSVDELPSSIKIVHPFKPTYFEDKNPIREILQHVKPFNLTLRTIAINSDAKHHGCVMLYVRAFSEPPQILTELQNSLLKLYKGFTGDSSKTPFLGVPIGFVSETEVSTIVKQVQKEWIPITFHVSSISFCKLILEQDIYAYYYNTESPDYPIEFGMEEKSIVHFGQKPSIQVKNENKSQVVEVSELKNSIKLESGEYLDKINQNAKILVKEMENSIQKGDLENLEKIIVVDPTMITNSVCRFVKSAQVDAVRGSKLQLLKILLKFPIRFSEPYQIFSKPLETSIEILKALLEGTPAFLIPVPLAPIITGCIEGKLPVQLLQSIVNSNSTELKQYSKTSNIKKFVRFNALEMAILSDNLDVVKVLLESKNFQVNAINVDAQRTPLHLAAEKGNVKIVKLLLDNFADPNKDLRNAGTPLSLAKDSETIQLLKERTKETEDKIKEISKKEGILGHREKAIVRILRDLKEIQENPLDSIEVIPSERDFFEWHIILSPPSDTYHPYRGLKFHFIFHMNDTYPVQPPSVKCSTLFKHPNVFSSDFICLDMIRYSSTRDQNGQKTGWTPAYSMYSVLMQFQAFLFDVYVPQYGEDAINEVLPSDVKTATDNVNAYRCQHCGYNVSFRGVSSLGSKPINKIVIKEENTKKEKQVITGPTPIFKLRDDEILLITDLLTDPKDLFYFMKSCKRFFNITTKYHVWERRELICFFSKRHFTEDILGVGIHVERQGSRLKSVTTAFDLLSRKAFFEDFVREAVWGQPFEYFLPLVLNPQHSKNSIPLLKSSLVSIVKGLETSKTSELWNVHTDITRRSVLQTYEEFKKFKELSTQFNPSMILDVIPKLMNNTVVEFMKVEKSGIVPLHSSEKALQGYCQFHHMMLKLTLSNPSIQNEISRRISHFIKDESRRVKLAVPDLGEFLVCLSISRDTTWEQIALPFIQELLDRQVLWTLDRDSGNHGELCFLEKQEISQYRLSTSFTCGLTGLRLLMFQYFFLNKIARPAGKTLEMILASYDSSYGFPAAGLPTRLQNECKKIHKVSSYKELFEYIGIAYPGDATMTSWLREAVIRSESKGYHKNRMSNLELFEWRCLFDKSLKPEDSPKEEEKKNTPNGKGYSIQLSGFTRKLDEESIMGAFRQFGEIMGVKISRNEKGEPESAQVTFSNYGSAESASIYGRDILFYGRSARIDFLDRKYDYKRDTARSYQRNNNDRNSNENSNRNKSSYNSRSNSNSNESRPQRNFFKDEGNSRPPRKSDSSNSKSTKNQTNNKNNSKPTNSNNNSAPAVNTSNIFSLLRDEAE